MIFLIARIPAILLYIRNHTICKCLQLRRQSKEIKRKALNNDIAVHHHLPQLVHIIVDTTLSRRRLPTDKAPMTMVNPLVLQCHLTDFGVYSIFFHHAFHKCMGNFEEELYSPRKLPLIKSIFIFAHTLSSNFVVFPLHTSSHHRYVRRKSLYYFRIYSHFLQVSKNGMCIVFTHSV